MFDFYQDDDLGRKLQEALWYRYAGWSRDAWTLIQEVAEEVTKDSHKNGKEETAQRTAQASKAGQPTEAAKND